MKEKIYQINFYKQEACSLCTLIGIQIVFDENCVKNC